MDYYRTFLFKINWNLSKLVSSNNKIVINNQNLKNKYENKQWKNLKNRYNSKEMLSNKNELKSLYQWIS